MEEATALLVYGVRSGKNRGQGPRGAWCHGEVPWEGFEGHLSLRRAGLVMLLFILVL